ncbi:hypothetical protein INT44_006671 [Umbelopsis vinacea]|uniref:Cytochrome P450 n=1 Tax=Umbelopsis vinacea TaxID=44442 RepID=A0A8H7PEN2_9FUNG|nr:hypothetical protein INT44_006671 [Umbelopsis vinacea]
MATITASATQYIDSLIQKLSGNENVEKLIEKLTAKENRSTILGSAAALLTAYYVLVHQMELTKPKGFRNIPKLNNRKNVMSLLRNEPFVDRYNANMKAQLEDQGIGRAKMAGYDIIFLATPEYSRTVLTNNDMFLKDTTETSPKYALVRKFFGGINLVFSNGDVWKRHRAVANPAFHRSWDTKLFGHCATEMSEQMDKDMASEGSVEIHSMFQRLTLDALGLAAFGFDFQSLRNPKGRYVTVYNDLMKGALNGLYFLFPYLDRFPIGQRYKMHQKLKEFDELLYDIIRTKKAEIASQKISANSDLLTMMIKAAEGEGATAKLSDQELRDNLSIFFLAGHDTTANSLACTLYYLALHPEYQARAREEALDAIGDDGSVPTSDQIKHLPFIDNCIKESLRLCPSVAQLPARVMADDFHLSNGYLLPKGSKVILAIYSMHHNKKYWGEDVEVFRPDRFDESVNGGKKVDPYLWVPFSFGSRSCIGQQFSMIEQRVVLTMLLQRYDFALPVDSPHRETLRFGRGGLLHPANLRLEVTPRA